MFPLVVSRCRAGGGFADRHCLKGMAASFDKEALAIVGPDWRPSEKRGGFSGGLPHR